MPAKIMTPPVSRGRRTVEVGIGSVLPGARDGIRVTVDLPRGKLVELHGQA